MPIILQEQRRGVCPKVIELSEDDSLPEDLRSENRGSARQRRPSISYDPPAKQAESRDPGAVGQARKGSAVQTPAGPVALPERQERRLKPVSRPIHGSERLDSWQSAVKMAELVRKDSGATIALDPESVFARQLGMMIRSGIKVEEGLAFLQIQATDEDWRDLLFRVKADYAHGARLAEALEEHPERFSRVLIGMVRSGEADGSLGENLERFAEQRDGEQRISNLLHRLWKYPWVVLTIANLTVSALLVFVIPQFKEIFMGMRIELPIMTRLLLFVSDAVSWLGIASIPLVVGLPFLAFETIVRVFGSLFRRIALAGFTRMLGTMLLSGVPLLQAVETAARTHGAPNVHGFFPEAQNADEKAIARLGAKLTELAVLYEADLEKTVHKVLRIVEPVVIIGMGLLVGAIVMAVFMPMTGLVCCCE